ncbi:MAG TPA: uridine kinase [Polyangiaceae bacterium]|jgi:uridine kinase|nr:uridine kinase [Polyangiaceae bacterium]
MSHATVLIGIAGGTGSGKTTLAQRIVAALPDDVTLLEQDSYYRDRSHLPPAERVSVNYDEPAALENDLLTAHLGSLRAGHGIDSPEYDFATHTRRSASRRIEPAPVVVVEGILLFAVPALRDAFDLRIFVDTDDDIRLMRRIRRDIIDRGRDIADIERQYYGTVRPMHLLHVAPSKRFAHLIVPEGGENNEALDVIVGRLRYLVLDARSRA